MIEQIVRPAGAAGETRAVALAAAAILIAATVGVHLQRHPEPAVVTVAHALDARRDLTAAEQGLLADLRVAAEEIAHRKAVDGRAPTPADLAAEGLPPFADGAADVRRGGHRWSLLEAEGRLAYIGLRSDPAIAGAMLLRLEGHAHAVWLSRAADVNAPGRLDDAGLSASGWRVVVTSFDAGVTRDGDRR